MKLSTALTAVTGSTALADYVSRAGVNIPGCEVDVPSCQDAVRLGPDQMAHFVNKDALNIFRLPLSWEMAVNNQLSGPLDGDYMRMYDKLVGACTFHKHAKCIIDVHNYARWMGDQIVGQSGTGPGAPQSSDLADLWSRLARRYKPYQNNNSQLVFGLMNEPHGVDIDQWADTCQLSVNRIRNVMGSNENWILLAGNNYDALGGFQYNSAPALSTVHNNDASRTTTNIVYEVHQYYDQGYGGKQRTCIPGLGAKRVNNQMKPLTAYLRQHGRKALLGETGGGPNNGDCISDVCAVLSYMNYNPDAYVGWLGWGAGFFATFNYELQESPHSDGTDVPLVAQCISGKFRKGEMKREIDWTA